MLPRTLLRSIPLMASLSFFPGAPSLEAANAVKRPAPLLSPEVHQGGSVTFRFKAPNAKEVKVSGQFGPATALAKGEDGVWSVTIPAVPAGIHEYRFSVDGVNQLDPQNAAIKPQRFPSTSLLHLPSHPPAPWDWQEIPHGTLHVHDYASQALGHPRRLHVYTPPPECGPGPFPTLYLSHGYSDNDASWSGHGKAHWILDALIAERRCKPMLVVMPDAHALALPTEPFDFFETYASPNTESFCRELQQDILPLIEKHYPVQKSPAGRAFAGLSMGGHHALAVALNLHAQFRYIGAFSAAPPAAALVSKALAEPGPVNRDLALLWIACGKNDFLFQRNLDFCQELTRTGLRFAFVETEGDHSWPVWRRYLVEFVPKLFSSKP